jgi:sigma-B regulation protein RsbU (phosphoserine phosphatase)
MFTDGVTEAVNTTYEEFGEKRLTATLGQLAKANCQQIIDSVKADVAAFVGEAEQSDDITLLAVKRI